MSGACLLVAATFLADPVYASADGKYSVVFQKDPLTSKREAHLATEIKLTLNVATATLPIDGSNDAITTSLVASVIIRRKRRPYPQSTRLQRCATAR
jgi:hypothetical protein